jgi:hypothetical protein
MRHSVKEPFAARLQIPDEELKVGGRFSFSQDLVNDPVEDVVGDRGLANHVVPFVPLATVSWAVIRFDFRRFGVERFCRVLYWLAERTAQ